MLGKFIVLQLKNLIAAPRRFMLWEGKLYGQQSCYGHSFQSGYAGSDKCRKPGDDGDQAAL